MKAPQKASTIISIMKESNTEIKWKMPEDHEGEYFFSGTDLWRKEEVPNNELLLKQNVVSV